MGKSKPAKNNSVPQTQEQQLATRIINDLNNWVNVGASDCELLKHPPDEPNPIPLCRYCEKLPEKYRPNHCLEYRLSIHNKLWITPIIRKLKLEGKGDAARDIEQLRDTLDKAVNAYNENLDPISPMHLPNFGLSTHAMNLANYLEGAKPYLGAQPAEQKPRKTNGGKVADLKAENTGEAGQNSSPSLIHIQNSNVIMGDVHRAENLQMGHSGSIRGQPDTPAETQPNVTTAQRCRVITWLKNHPHSYSLIGGIACLIFLLVVGAFKPEWRNWCWGSAAVPFLVLVLSLLGGRSGRYRSESPHIKGEPAAGLHRERPGCTPRLFF